jgi:hypothetical protein
MPDDGHVLRVFRFRPVVSEFDAFMRTEMLPAVARLPGLLAVHAGRRDQDSGGDRIVATIWESRAAMIDVVGASLEQSPFFPNGWRRRSTGRSTRSTSGPELPFSTAGAGTAATLPGTVRPGELEDYVSEGGTGTLADATPGRDPRRSISPRTRLTTSSRCRSGRHGAIASRRAATSERPTITRTRDASSG